MGKFGQNGQNGHRKQGSPLARARLGDSRKNVSKVSILSKSRLRANTHTRTHTVWGLCVAGAGGRVGGSAQGWF